MATTESVKPGQVKEALDYVRSGGRLCVRTYTRITVIDAKCLARFEKLNEWLLRACGNGYRLRSGKGSVYLMPGQLERIVE